MLCIPTRARRLVQCSAFCGTVRQNASATAAAGANGGTRINRVRLNCGRRLYRATVAAKRGFLYRPNLAWVDPIELSDDAGKWPRGGVVTQRSAKPCTPVQFRAWPPAFAERSEGCRTEAQRRRAAQAGGPIE